MDAERHVRHVIAFTDEELDAIYHAIENAPSDASREQAYENVIDKIVPPHNETLAMMDRERDDGP